VLQPDLAETDAGSQIDIHDLEAAAGENLNSLAARILVKLVESEIAVPRGNRCVGNAAQITAPRSLKTLTRSCLPMPRSLAFSAFMRTIQ